MNSFASESWWTPMQAALVEDRTREWRLMEFAPSDAVSFSVDGRTIIGKRAPHEKEVPPGHIVPGGWDHVHCELCWTRISLFSGDQSCAYTDTREWICKGCYDKYIVPRL